MSTPATPAWPPRPKLYLIAEFWEAEDIADARAQLDAFRESALPGPAWAITLYEDPNRPAEIINCRKGQA